MATEHHEAEHHQTSGGRPRPDDTPPRNRVIFTYTVLAVITLVGLKFVFDSYLDTSRRGIRAEHLGESHTSEALAEYRDQQSQRLAGGAMPIERAMRELGRRGRSAFPLIRPAPSEDLDPLRGWAQLPRELPPGAEPPPPAPEETAVPPAEGALPQGTLPDESGAAAAPPAVPAEPAGGEGAGAAPAQPAPDGAAPGEGAPEARPAPEATPTPPTPRVVRPRRPAAPAEGAPAAEGGGAAQ